MQVKQQLQLNANCDSPVTISEKMVGDFKPNVIIPFHKTKQDVETEYKKFIKKGILTSKDFFRENVIEKMHGVYVPFYLYSMDAYVDFTANVKQEKTSYNIPIKATATLENIPVDSSTQFDDALMDSVNEFKMTSLEPFNDAYMAGFLAEAGDDDEQKMFVKASEMGAKEIAKVVGDLPSIRANSTTVKNTTTQNITIKKALLPVWLLNVKYKGKIYPFAMNGQTGKMTGKIPPSPAKVSIMCIITIFLFVLLPNYFMLRNSEIDSSFVTYTIIIAGVIIGILMHPYHLVKKAIRSFGCIKKGTLVVLSAQHGLFDIAQKCNIDIAEGKAISKCIWPRY